MGHEWAENLMLLFCQHQQTNSHLVYLITVTIFTYGMDTQTSHTHSLSDSPVSLLTLSRRVLAGIYDLR